MPTIAEQLTQLASDRDDLVDNLTTQGISGLTGNETFTELVPKVLDIEGGGGGPEEKTVFFYDYDGTVTNSYTKTEFLALESLPSNPSHSGLTAQGWNWNLADAKSYVTNYNKLSIGQMYITDTGETRVYITLNDDDRLNPYLSIGVKGTVTVDWGDGNTQTITGTNVNTLKSTQHTYSIGGNYVIRISGGRIGIIGDLSNSKLIWSNSSGNINRGYASNITKIELGNNITSIGESAFSGCYSLQSITIPDTVTSIGSSTFNSCYSLQGVTIPSGVTSISTYVFQNCYSLQGVTIPSGVTSIRSGTFQNCYSLQSITIPDTVTSIGTSTFSTCYSLQSIAIPDTVTSIDAYAFSTCYSLQGVTIPSGVTSISTSAFSGCQSLQSITIPSGVTSIGNYAFSGCYSLQNITIPDTVTSIGENAFRSCYSLQSIAIPSGVTSIGTSTFSTCYSLQSIAIPDTVTSIGSSTFSGCQSLQSITIPSGVTSIGSVTFSGCSYAKYFDFSTHTDIPTLSTTNAFSNIASDCKIIVPDDLYDDWKVATNWSTYASYIVKESDYNA